MGEVTRELLILKGEAPDARLDIYHHVLVQMMHEATPGASVGFPLAEHFIMEYIRDEMDTNLSEGRISRAAYPKYVALVLLKADGACCPSKAAWVRAGNRVHRRTGPYAGWYRCPARSPASLSRS